jgi:hypothetical protein
MIIKIIESHKPFVELLLAPENVSIDKSSDRVSETLFIPYS